MNITSESRIENEYPLGGYSLRENVTTHIFLEIVSWIYDRLRYD